MSSVTTHRLFFLFESMNVGSSPCGREKIRTDPAMEVGRLKVKPCFLQTLILVSQSFNLVGGV
jgi:hypothetical protein